MGSDEECGGSVAKGRSWNSDVGSMMCLGEVEHGGEEVFVPT